MGFVEDVGVSTVVAAIIVIIGDVGVTTLLAAIIVTILLLSLNEKRRAYSKKQVAAPMSFSPPVSKRNIYSVSSSSSTPPQWKKLGLKLTTTAEAKSMTIKEIETNLKSFRQSYSSYSQLPVSAKQFLIDAYVKSIVVGHKFEVSTFAMTGSAWATAGVAVATGGAAAPVILFASIGATSFRFAGVERLDRAFKKFHKALGIEQKECQNMQGVLMPNSLLAELVLEHGSSIVSQWSGEMNFKLDEAALAAIGGAMQIVT